MLIYLNLNSIDLTVASSVHIVEPHWNPMAEAQAVDRVHRIGQTREVEVVRYCVKDSIEEVSQLFPNFFYLRHLLCCVVVYSDPGMAFVRTVFFLDDSCHADFLQTY